MRTGVRVALVLIAAAGCGARNAERRPDPVPGDVLECRPPRKAARTFVGFSAGMSLDHFELAAFEAERIVAMLAATLCAVPSAQADDSLLDVLASALQLEITSIQFTRDDASVADVRIQLSMTDELTAGMAGPAGQRHWLLRAVREQDRWQIDWVWPRPALETEP